MLQNLWGLVIAPAAILYGVESYTDADHIQADLISGNLYPKCPCQKLTWPIPHLFLKIQESCLTSSIWCLIDIKTFVSMNNMARNVRTCISYGVLCASRARTIPKAKTDTHISLKINDPNCFTTVPALINHMHE